MSGETGRVPALSSEALLAVLEEAVVVHDALGTVAACNPAAERILALPASAIVGRAALFAGLKPIVASGAPLWPEEEPVRIALKTGRAVPEVTVRFQRQGGEVAWVRLWAAPLPEAGQGGITLMADLTYLKAIEQDLRGSLRMEAVGRLAGSVAHDFNNWLMAICGYNEILLRELDPADPRRYEAEEVQKAAESAAGLTRQLLAFSRGQALETRVVDLNGVLADMQAILARIVGEEARLAFTLAEGLSATRVDRAQIEQVVLNLTMNARDAMPTGGEIRIATANVQIDPEVAAQHAGLRPGRYVRLSVSDDGTGMDAVTQAHIFEPFFTTKPRDKGTGLGLATVYGIIKQSDGYIEVRSAQGSGATFELYLPVSDEPITPELPGLLGGMSPRTHRTVSKEGAGPSRRDPDVRS